MLNQNCHREERSDVAAIRQPPRPVNERRETKVSLRNLLSLRTFRDCFVTVFLAMTALFPCTSVAQQAFPTKPIRLVVPLAPGGGGDLVSRMIAQKISEPLGQPVVVENKPGGSTIIGTELVARSTPD